MTPGAPLGSDGPSPAHATTRGARCWAALICSSWHALVNVQLAARVHKWIRSGALLLHSSLCIGCIRSDMMACMHHDEAWWWSLPVCTAVMMLCDVALVVQVGTGVNAPCRASGVKVAESKAAAEPQARCSWPQGHARSLRHLFRRGVAWEQRGGLRLERVWRFVV
jgi:hypothetical protein